MNMLSFLARNNIPMRPGNSTFLSFSSYFQKNRPHTNNYKGKSNIIINKTNNNTNIYKSPKSLNFNNQMTDLKKNSYKKTKLTNTNINHIKTTSFFDKNKKINNGDSNLHIIQTEPNRINNNIQFFSENNNINNKNNKQSNQLLIAYYNNKKLSNKMSIKKNKTFNINLNENLPNNNEIDYYSNTGRNINLFSNNEMNNTSDIKNKHKSYTNLKKIINKDFPNFQEILNDKDNININIKTPELTIKNLNKNKNNIQKSNINSPSTKRHLSTYSSNLYLKTENDINMRANSTNFNLININPLNDGNNIPSNNNAFQKTQKLNYQNYLNFIYLQSHKNNSASQKNKKNHKKGKDNYSYNQNDFKMNKISLNQFYEDTFNDTYNENGNIKNNIINKIKFNNEDIFYKENLTTNQSTYRNISKKIKNMKQILSSKMKTNDSNVDNFEELHFFVVTNIQKGKNCGKKFN